MTLAFLGILYILGKYAWKPVMKALKERESSISDALNAANIAKEEMKQLKAHNEQLLQEARNERDIMLADARKVRESIIEESKQKATEEAQRIVASAKETIQNEKMAAMTDLKNQIGDLALDVARKVLNRELSDLKKQHEYMKELLKEVKLN